MDNNSKEQSDKEIMDDEIINHSRWDEIHDQLKNEGYSTGSEEQYDKLYDECKRRIKEIIIQEQSGEQQERFKRPTDQQVVKAAILFNDGLIDKKQLSNMVALADFIIDRLYENGDMSIPSSKEK